MSTSKPPLIVILGPTSCGKTKLAISLARRFNGEIVSADSRQVYRELNIGTGKDLSEYEKNGKKIPYYLINVADPQKQFSLADYQKQAYQAISRILEKKKLPFLVGGTGLYLKSITDGLVLPPAKPNYKLRQELEKMKKKEQLAILKKINPKIIKKIDINNPRRLVRAIEISRQNSSDRLFPKKNPRFSPLILGITCAKKEIKKKIKLRLEKRIKQGLIEEVENLHKKGLGWKRLADFGLEYRYVPLFLRGEISREALIEKLNIANSQLAKRQMTWFKRDSRIKWIGSEREASELIEKYILAKKSEKKTTKKYFLF
jgi:tRNA dimethylallyltransferase